MVHFNNTVTQKADGRYCIHLPWIGGHPPLPENKAHAIARLHHTTKDLVREDRLDDYHNIFMSWLKEGIIQPVPPSGSAAVVHYLPHRAVYKENSTTPTRPVFNASAKKKGYPSVNECLEVGPNLLERIPSIITAFRKEKVGVIADIRKAFLQIEVTEQDRDCMRFLWWKDPQERKELVEYRHCRVVFGVSSSPFLLGVTLQHLLNQYEDQYGETVKTLRNALYVDNTVASFPTMEKAKNFEKEARQIMTKGKFDLRGWEYGPVSDRKQVQVLGMLWNTYEDTLQFDLTGYKKRGDLPTKRNILAHANTLFDLLGLLSPFVISVKLLFKNACLDSEKYEWDTPLTQHYEKQLQVWKSQVSSVSEIRFPRFVAVDGADQDDWSLHCFCDASSAAYATCVYLRVDPKPVHVQMLQARARVTPEKRLTIPRAELLSCLIGVRLVNQIIADLQIPDIPVYYWSVSTTALTWIRKTDSVCGVYVNNRVKEIRSRSSIMSWRHVPGSKALK